MVEEDGKIVQGIMTGPLLLNKDSKKEKVDLELISATDNYSSNAEERLTRIIETNYNGKTIYPQNLINPIETVLGDLFVEGRNYNFLSLREQIYSETLRKVLRSANVPAAERRAIRDKEFGKTNPLFRMAAKSLISFFNNEEAIARLNDCNTLYDVKLLLFIDDNLTYCSKDSKKYDLLVRFKNSSLEDVASYSYKLRNST
ncbi:MAG: hypothetical protein JSW73_00615 [Candidatus Woesearchaeota archaeon]|nr:MAG: hypothetical protein JSW73_00615 [Candidatus Woesearchaeota archaeon]